MNFQLPDVYHSKGMPNYPYSMPNRRFTPPNQVGTIANVQILQLLQCIWTAVVREQYAENSSNSSDSEVKFTVFSRQSLANSRNIKAVYVRNVVIVVNVATQFCGGGNKRLCVQKHNMRHDKRRQKRRKQRKQQAKCGKYCCCCKCCCWESAFFVTFVTDPKMLRCVGGYGLVSDKPLQPHR